MELVVTWKKLVAAAVLIVAVAAGYYRFFRGVSSMDTKELFEEHIRWNPVATYHLKKRKAAHAVSDVSEYLTHGRADVRTLAVKLLARPGDADAAEAAFSLAGDPSAEVRTAVARSLGEVNVKQKVVPSLAWMLNDKDPQVQTAVTLALKDVTGVSGVHGVDGWQHWWDMHRTEY